MLTILLFLISGWKGSVWWTQDVAQVLGPRIGGLIHSILGPIQLNHFFVLFGGAFIGYNILMSFVNIKAMSEDPNADAAHHPPGMTKNPLVIFMPYLVYIPLNTLWVYWASFIPGQEILEHNIMVVFMYAMGIGFAYQVGLMVLAHVCQRKFPTWNHVWTYTTICTVITYLKAHGYIETAPSQKLLIWGYLAVSCGVYGVFANGVIREMCDIFDIWCLRIKYLPSEEVERIRSRGWKGWDVLGLRKLPPADSVGKKAE
jgi:ethanolaminephosphotransferase